MLIRFAMKDFLADKELENLSEKTVSAYQMLFKDVLRWCGENELTRVSELTTRTIKNYLRACKEKGNNSVTLNTKRRQFRAWFNWLKTEEIITDNPTDDIKRAKEDIHIYAFTDSEIAEILSDLRRTKRKEDSVFAVRNYTAFLTLIGTGMRAGELCSLRWCEVDLVSRTVKVFGKMREEQSIPLDSKLCRELAYWREYCLKQFDGNLSEHVFVTRQNKPLTVNGLKCFFKRLAIKMDFPQTRCSAHTCRHYFAKCWIRNGGDISTLAKMLRHTSVKTTEKYLHFFGNEVASDNEKYNPLNNLRL